MWLHVFSSFRERKSELTKQTILWFYLLCVFCVYTSTMSFCWYQFKHQKNPTWTFITVPLANGKSYSYYRVQWKKALCDFFCCLLSGFCLNFKAHTQKQTDIMLVTLVPLLASEPGDQDSVKEASLECLLKDEKGTEEACPLFIFSTRCCLDLNLSRCVSNRPVKQRWIIWLWWQGHTGQLWLAPSSVTRHHCITVTFLLLNQTWPTEHIPSNSQHCSLLSSSCYQAKSWPMASFPSSVEQNNTWHQPDR